MIKQLSEQTAEQLCAQQVITSLPDCIKQLIDNSIDAGSTFIKITLTEYGKQRVEVVDNGFGIDDFNFLGKKGSTSKNKGDDQFNYLGFRGEAVHSIGRVSQEMQIQSKSSVDGFRRTFNVNTLDLQIFKQERLCHGQFNFQVPNKQGSKSTGTKVTIEGIFKKLPVRQIQLHTKYKDFLKKTNEIIKQFCLIYPEIQFIFINNREGKQEIIIQTSAQKTFSQLTWLERIKEMDERIGNSLVYIESQLLEGFVLNKIESGSSRQNNFIKKHYHYLFLNRRPIDVVTTIQTTLNQLYKKYNNNTKYAFLINLKLDHSKIDINLTPNKREIFIRKEVLERIVKDLRDQIVEKVIKEIPTLSGFEDKKKGTQSQLSVNSLQNGGEETKEMKQRKTISFLPQRTEEDFKPATDKTEQKNDFSSNRGDDKFATFRQSMNVARSGMQAPTQSKKQAQSSKPKPMSDLPELQKVNVDMSKLKEQLKSRLSQNIGIIKRTSTLPSSLGPTSQPVNSQELQSIRKENQEKKIREEEQDARRRVDFMKEVKIQYGEEEPNKVPKAINDKYRSKDGHSASGRRNKDSQSLYEENQYKQNHSQIGQDEVQEVQQRFVEKPKQAGSKQLEERIKAKINIDMSQIFVKFNNKNKQKEAEKSEEVAQHKTELAFFDDQHHHPREQTVQEQANHQPEPQQQQLIRAQTIEQSPEEALQQQPAIIDGKGNETTKSIKKQNFKDFEIIGQFNLGFILCLFNHQYFLVDQHAASEKFHYQKFLRQSYTLQSIRSQEKQEITGIQADQIEECKNILKESGFHYKITDRNYLQLERCPLFFGGRLGLEYFWQIVEQKKELHRIGKFTAMCAMKACKTAVVVGNPLRYAEMRQIVNNLADLDSPWNCPHGRPTLVQLGRRESFRGKVTPIKTAKSYDL